MRIFVRVMPKSKFEKVEPVGPWHFKVFIKTIPEKGKANKAVVSVLADFFKIPKSKIALRSGASSREKTFEVKI